MKKGKNILFIMLACLMLSGCGGKADSSANSIIVENVQNEAISEKLPQESTKVTTSNKGNESKEDINQEIDLNKETDASAQSEEQSKQDELPVQEQKQAQPETAQKQEAKQKKEVPQEQETPQQQSDYGRIFFIGDSRTVDMFDKDATEIFDYKAGDIRVFARDGCVCTYMYDVMNQYGEDEFDTVVSWLGCNDNKDVDSYKIIYEEILSKGKNLVICTVGPTADEYLSGDWDVTNYPNQYIISFNQKITEWAGSHGIKVIDLYSYVSNNIEISQDGIHYNPKPTTAIWNYILSELYY